MKARYILTIALSSTYCFAQIDKSDHIVDEQFGDLRERPKSKEKAEGTIYLWNENQTGTIVKNNGDSLVQVTFNYDIISDRIESLRDKKYFTLNGSSVDSFVINHAPLSSNSYFRNGKISDFLSDGFYLILARGEISFYSRSIIDYYPSNYNAITDSGYEHDRYVKTIKFYLVSPEKLLIETKSLKKVLSYLIKKDSVYKQYAKKNKLKPTENSIARLLQLKVNQPLK